MKGFNRTAYMLIALPPLFILVSLHSKTFKIHVDGLFKDEKWTY